MNFAIILRLVLQYAGIKRSKSVKKTKAMNFLKERIHLKSIIILVLSIMMIAFILYKSNQAFEYKTDAFPITEAYALENDEVYQQSIPFVEGKLQSFSLKMATYGRVNKGSLQVAFYQNDVLVQQWSYQTELLVDDAYQEFMLDHKVAMSKNDNYYITVINQFDGENNIAMYTSNAGHSLSTKTSGNLNRTACYQLILENSKIKNQLTLPFVGAFLVLTMFALLFIDFRKYSLLKLVVYAVIGFVMIEIVSVDLFQQIRTDVAGKPLVKSAHYQTIEPMGTIKATFDTRDKDFTALEFMVSKDSPNLMGVRLVNADTNIEYINRDVLEGEVTETKYDGKIIRMNALGTDAGSAFIAGKYNVYITNKDSARLVNVNVIQNKDGKTSFNYALRESFGIGYVVAVIVLILIGIYILVILIYTNRNTFKVEQFFLCSVIPLALIYLTLMLPWSAPDTDSHYRTTYRYSNIFLGYEPKDEWMERADDSAIYMQMYGMSNPDVQDYTSVFKSVSGKVEHSEDVMTTCYSYMNCYSILNYLPQVIGITIGRLLGLGTILMIYLARIMIVIAYILACYHAIKIAPVGKIMFATIPLLPMSLMLSNTFSYDAMVIISTLCFVASILRLYHEKENKFALFETMFWIFVIGGVKGGGYLILLPLVMVLATKDLKKSLKLIIPIVLSGISSVVLFDIVLIGRPMFQLGNGNGGKMTASFALAEPLKYLHMLMQTYLQDIDMLAIDMGGTLLGWREPTIPYVFIAGLMLIIGVYAIYEADQLQLKNMDKWIFGAILLIELVFTPMMLLSWTPIGSLKVEGLQGRYYLPTLILIFLLFTKFKLHNDVEISDNKALAIKQTCIKWFVLISCICIYYMLRLYLRR